MTKKPVDIIIIILATALIFSEFGILAYRDDTPRSPRDYHIKAEIIQKPRRYHYPHYNRPTSYAFNWYIPYVLANKEITYTTAEYTSLGYYYITAYCPAECGYNGSNYPAGWRTASGTICHRADYQNRLSEPTTCAISRTVHSFGDLFYISEFDRVFIGEDTGSSVQGKHLDLFYEEYSDVQSFPTGWYEVFEVEYTTKTTTMKEFITAPEEEQIVFIDASGGQNNG